VWIGVFVAATIGASVGVLAALTHNSAEESVPPAPEHPAMVRAGSAPSTTTPSTTAPATTAPATSGAAVTPIATTITPAPAKTVARVESPNPVRRRPHHDADDMPMTVVPPDPPQQKIVAHPLPVTSTPAPKVVAPQPSQPQPSQPQPSDEPPPAPPPPANDPTTLPPPSAAN
jgi:hypothetical protein